MMQKIQSLLNGEVRQLREITDKLLSTAPGSVEAHLAEIRGFASKRLSNLQELLSGETTLARTELKKRVEEIRMTPQYAEGRPHYLAEGAWNLLGNQNGPAHNTAPLLNRMVAGACNAAKTLVLPFRDRLPVTRYARRWKVA